MSDQKNRNDGMQDYLDLLEKYGKDEKSPEKEEKKVKIDNISEEINDDFFGDYDVNEESEKVIAPPPVKEDKKDKKGVNKINESKNK